MPEVIPAMSPVVWKKEKKIRVVNASIAVVRAIFAS